MKEDKPTQETETERDALKEAVDERSLSEAVREFVFSNEVTKFPQSVLIATLRNLLKLSDIDTFQKVISETLRNPTFARNTSIKNSETTIPLRIVEEPLTAQNVALILTTLTELATELWLIGKRRFADLAEYTQTHDVRFTNEAGITIAWIYYNSPLEIGLQLAQIVPGLADAIMTIINGIAQIMLKREKLKLENQAASQQIEEARQNAEDKHKMEELNRKMIEIEVQQRQWEMYTKMGIVSELETGITILLPSEGVEIKSMSKQLMLPTVLQLSNTKGLELALPTPKTEEGSPKENAGQ